MGKKKLKEGRDETETTVKMVGGGGDTACGKAEQNGSKVDVSESYQEREKWGGKMDFLLSCIGYSVGLGNVWRFPYLCYKNGGGAFLIPYVICLFTSGVPVFFLEVAIGQFMSEGCVTVWKLCPAWKGIGYGTVVIIAFLNVYYIVVLAWALLYMFMSFTTVLPWSHCNNPWNTPRCYSPFTGGGNGTSSNFTFTTTSSAPSTTTSAEAENTNTTPTSVDPSVEFWENRILRKSSGIEEMGTVNWDLALTLLLGWIMIYFIIFKGVRSSGKVVYFTATFPYVIITILLIRGVTLDGALDGIIFYLKPNFSKLLEAEVWMDAGTQIFFSYAIATGALVAMGSYNKYNNDCYKDCAIIAVINSGTSLYAGFAIFSVLGFMAKQQGVPVSKVAESGPGLAFIAYPKAVSLMPGAPFWAVLFFFMVILLGLDSQFVGVEGLVTAIIDMYPGVLRRGRRKEVFVGVVCLITYLIGLAMISEGGIYVFHLFNNYAASGFTLIWFCFFECVAMAWVYGHEKFYKNLEDMIGYRMNLWMKAAWMFLGPLVCTGIFAFSLSSYRPLKYGDYEYPPWADGVGWLLALASMLWIPAYMIYAFATASGNLRQRWIEITTPRLPANHPSRRTEVTGVPMISMQKQMDGEPAPAYSSLQCD